MVEYFKQGNTITMTATFYAEDDSTLVDPDQVTLKVYDNQYKEQQTYTPSRASLGVFVHKWVPDREGAFIVEVRGMIEGLPSLERKTLHIRFV